MATTTSELVFACHSKACAPPPIGSGGSGGGGKGRGGGSLASRLAGGEDVVQDGYKLQVGKTGSYLISKKVDGAWKPFTGGRGKDAADGARIVQDLMNGVSPNRKPKRPKATDMLDGKERVSSTVNTTSRTVRGRYGKSRERINQDDL